MLRTVEDAERLAADVTGRPRTAVVIGAGFVGLETAENLARQGIAVTVVEAAAQVLTPLDPELAILVAAELVAHGVTVETGVAVAEVTDRGRPGRRPGSPGELVVGSIGVRPDVRLAEMAGLELGPHGGIAVDEVNRTSDPDIYAVGDAVEKADSVGGGTSLIALANVANRQGRRVADAHLWPCRRAATPSLGTAIVKVFDLTAATTGWNERRLRAAGRRYRAIHSHPMSHAGYYPGAEPMSLKLLFDPDDGTILGAQAVGGDGVDKRIDVIATAMAGGITADAAGRPRAGLCSAVLVGQGPGQHARLHGRERPHRRVRRRGVRRARESSPIGLDTDRRPHAEEHARGRHPRSHQPAARHAPRRRSTVLGEGPFVVYCEVGQRGHTATSLLHELGIEGPKPRRWLPDVAGGRRCPRDGTAPAGQDCNVIPTVQDYQLLYVQKRVPDHLRVV